MDGKRTVTLALDAAVVEEVARRGLDLSLTVDTILRRQLRPHRPMTDDEVAGYVESANAWYDEHGLAGQDFLPI